MSSRPTASCTSELRHARFAISDRPALANLSASFTAPVTIIAAKLYRDCVLLFRRDAFRLWLGGGLGRRSCGRSS